MTATVHPLSANRAPSLDPMVALVASDMNGVNAVILERMQSKVALIPELAGHLIAGGGKRMRPMLTLACANLLGYPGTRHHKLAAAVEFIHTATLLHDDVVDGSSMRMPGVRITTLDGKNMELAPRPVDIPVTRPIGESLEGKDSQLDTAVRELLKQLGTKRTTSDGRY